ncbi:MAG: ParB/RepB/Spo0J family partition protein [Pseudomonadota bacterium]|nr:ParB/RepB/Spo0J family partition protein [Pseudomonadota bacterium]MEC9097981.1 ParB/RepB/Spo0J family partition protein [Pseudomonadota bacterium]MED5484361.1 ParB/RepB/Spo0J family partition protein [Pseudomonadota bacterium]
MNKKKGLGKGLAALIGEKESLGNDINKPNDVSIQNLRQSDEIPIEFLHPNKNQPRKLFDEEKIDELSQSIKQKGLILPILVKKIDENNYQIIAGERRWRASQKAGLHDVPVIIKNLDDKEILEIALIENMQREDLNPIEEAEGIARLQDEFKYTQEELSNILGKSRPQISNTIRLLKLPQKVKEFVQNKTLSAGHARALVGLEDSYAIAQVAIKKNMNVRQLETYISYVKNKRGKKGNKTKDPNILSLENEITQMLGLIIKIDHKNSEKGKLEIFYNNLEQLDDLIKKLRK